MSKVDIEASPVVLEKELLAYSGLLIGVECFILKLCSLPLSKAGEEAAEK